LFIRKYIKEKLLKDCMKQKDVHEIARNQNNNGTNKEYRFIP